MLNFNYPQPPAVVRLVELKAAEAVESPSRPKSRRQKRQEVPMHERSARAQSFAATRLKDKLRPVLMAIDPHCHRCGRGLQSMDSSVADTFARVMLAEQKLACESCVNAISKERNEARQAAIMQERIAEFLSEQAERGASCR